MDPSKRTTLDWHARYVQQAGWTRDLRRYLYQRAELSQARRVLDVGCGTGVLLSELLELSGGTVAGLDISQLNLSLAGGHAPDALLIHADAHNPPLASASFDIILCHFLLLWLEDPGLCLTALVRLLRPGGALLVLAEPDYGGRIDYPEPLTILGEWQHSALSSEGANPQMGRRVRGLLTSAGLVQVESGVLGAQWVGAPSPEDLDLEWAVLEHDLTQIPGAMDAPGEIEQQLQELIELEASAWKSGERILYIPTFYAWGKAGS